MIGGIMHTWVYPVLRDWSLNNRILQLQPAAAHCVTWPLQPWKAEMKCSQSSSDSVGIFLLKCYVIQQPAWVPNGNIRSQGAQVSCTWMRQEYNYYPPRHMSREQIILIGYSNNTAAESVHAVTQQLHTYCPVSLITHPDTCHVTKLSWLGTRITLQLQQCMLLRNSYTLIALLA